MPSYLCGFVPQLLPLGRTACVPEWRSEEGLCKRLGVGIPLPVFMYLLMHVSRLLYVMHITCSMLYSCMFSDAPLLFAFYTAYLCRDLG